MLRWKEAFDAGVAPPVVLESTHENALQFVTLDELRQHADDAHENVSITSATANKSRDEL